jgi:hypothetical protein
VAVGAGPWSEADAWIDSDRIANEAEERVQLAYRRGRSRRAAAREAMRDRHRADASLGVAKKPRHAHTREAPDPAPRAPGAWCVPARRMPDPTAFPHHSQEVGNDLAMH